MLGELIDGDREYRKEEIQRLSSEALVGAGEVGRRDQQRKWERSNRKAGR